MSDYIKRSDAIKVLNEFREHLFAGILQARAEIIDIPAADVIEVIRCKDCKHSGGSVYGNEWIYCDKMHDDLEENGFCSYGERRDAE